jgi:hypothetical protein
MLRPLGTILELTLQQVGLEQLVLLGRLIRAWPEIVGAPLAKVARPQRLRARVLFVTVNDAIWLQQCTFYHTQILSNIRKTLGDVPIAKVHFSLAMAVPPPLLPEADISSEVCPLTLEEDQQVCAGTAHVADPELRDILRRAWRRGWQARKQVL